MERIRIGEQIAFLRREKGITQEELARHLGVSNQAVSKWESGQNCPDIQLLPEIARLFQVSVDQLLGYQGEKAEGDAVLLMKRTMEGLPEGEDGAWAWRAAAALHTLILSKVFLREKLVESSGWVTEEAVEHAGKAEWGYSNMTSPEVITIMRKGGVFFAKPGPLQLSNGDIRRIRDTLCPFLEKDALRAAAALYQLTCRDEDSFAGAGEVAAACEMKEEQVEEILSDTLAEFVEENGEGYRLEGRYQFVPALLSMFDMH